MKKGECITSELKLVNSDPGNSSGRFRIYGDYASEIENMINKNPDLGIPIDPRLPYTRAEMIWICRNEMPLNLDDLLARRSRALLLNAKASSDIAAEAAGIMAEEMGYDDKWQEEQVESYRQLVKNYI